MKLSRAGIGAESPADVAARKRKEVAAAAMNAAIAAAKAREAAGAEYASSQSKKFAAVKMERDIDACRRVIQDLESSDLVGITPSIHFWPDTCKADPSTTSASHNDLSVLGDVTAAGLATSPSDSEWISANSPEERLTLLLLHLRNVHLYCFYCGTAFASHEDLATNCPGLLDSDH